jgi:transcriptional regulator
VGIEFAITGVEAKAKRSQNRSEMDRDGVIRGLRSEPGHGNAAMADQMQSDLEAT